METEERVLPLDLQWIRYGVQASHIHPIDKHSLKDVYVCREPKYLDGCWQVKVMPEDKSTWLVECEHLTQGWKGIPISSENYSNQAKEINIGYWY